mgnify:CR=1 FL=1
MKKLTNEDISNALDHPVFRLIGDTADELDLECYVIGGWVRDLFLQRPSKDIDIVVAFKDASKRQQQDNDKTSGSRPGIMLAEALKKKLKKANIAIYRNFGTAQLKSKGVEIEFVGARKESYDRNSRKPVTEDGTLEEDQNRRDFTINAMALCLNADHYGTLVDPFNGTRDLEDKIIATPLDPDITFSDDPLRMMRAIRFATQLGFNLDGETFDAIVRNRERIHIITRERIAEELNKIMLSRRPSEGWLLLDKTGLLPLIFPELAALKGVEVKEGRGHKDVFLHTLKVLDNVASLQPSAISRQPSEVRSQLSAVSYQPSAISL